jgi:hypothetical protein
MKKENTVYAAKKELILPFLLMRFSLLANSCKEDHQIV